MQNKVPLKIFFNGYFYPIVTLTSRKSGNP